MPQQIKRKCLVSLVGSEVTGRPDGRKVVVSFTTSFSLQPSGVGGVAVGSNTSDPDVNSLNDVFLRSFISIYRREPHCLRAHGGMDLINNTAATGEGLKSR